jgi:predicted small lipoprotein YifL
MKKVLSLLALAMMIVGLTGCLDPQDGTRQRPDAAASVSL